MANTLLVASDESSGTLVVVVLSGSGFHNTVSGSRPPVPPNPKGVTTKKNGDHEHSNKNKRTLKPSLAAVENSVGSNAARLQEHVDESEKQTGSLASGPVSAPLKENQNGEVTEDAKHENDLWDVLEEDQVLASKVREVEVGQGNTEAHMNDTQDDRHLHLVRVQESELVFSKSPVRVNTERIGASEIFGNELKGRAIRVRGFVGNGPATSKQIHRLGEHIVVDQTGVDGEKAHQKNEVATPKESGPHFAPIEAGELLLVKHNCQSSQSQKNAMTEVAEHNREQERESNHGEQTGVHLTVGCHTIGVDDGLETFSELVSLVICGRLELGLHSVENGGNQRATLFSGTTKGELNVVESVNRDPSFGDQALASHVEVEHVHSVVDGLNLGNLRDPAFKLKCNV
eukprot:Colp12_sorted_trinity150504_noHs@34485